MSGPTTRSQQARKTQSTRDAVLNNPDLLCHIAEQADLPSAIKLLTTSKHNFICCEDFFYQMTLTPENRYKQDKYWYKDIEIEYDDDGIPQY